MKSRFAFSRHAMQRYIQRIAPQLDLDGARDALEASEPIKLRQRGRGATTLWLIGPPQAYLVTKPQDGTEVCVTVLGPTDIGTDDRDGQVVPPYPPVPEVAVVVAVANNERAKNLKARQDDKQARRDAHQAMVREHAARRAAKLEQERAVLTEERRAAKLVKAVARVGVRFLMEHSGDPDAREAIERIRRLCVDGKQEGLLEPKFYMFERRETKP